MPGDTEVVLGHLRATRPLLWGRGHKGTIRSRFSQKETKVQRIEKAYPKAKQYLQDIAEFRLF